MNYRYKDWCSCLPASSSLRQLCEPNAVCVRLHCDSVIELASGIERVPVSRQGDPDGCLNGFFIVSYTRPDQTDHAMPLDSGEMEPCFTRHIYVWDTTQNHITIEIRIICRAVVQRVVVR
jgi:hypothetical protein